MIGVVKVDFADIRPTWWSSTGGPRVCLTKINPIFERFRAMVFQRGVEHPNRVSFREVGAVFGSQQKWKNCFFRISHTILLIICVICVKKLDTFCLDSRFDPKMGGVTIKNARKIRLRVRESEKWKILRITNLILFLYFKGKFLIVSRFF